MNVRISLLAVLVGAGCVGGNGDAPGTGEVEQGICQEFMCGTNSPQIASFGFWDLNLPTTAGVGGAANNVGMQLAGFLVGSTWYLPRVYAGKLTASRVSDVAPFDTITLSGSQLVGGALVLVNQARVFEIRIDAVGTVDSWAQPATKGTRRVALETYLLDWSEFLNGHFGDFRNVCKSPPSRENPDDLGMIGDLAFQSLLFEGDRIDAIGKRDTGVDNTWFNIGCAGSALAKLALTGHTQAARNARTFDTTLLQRQAMLKLFAADYCGDGTAFTVAGQPLNWKDDRSTMAFLAPPAHLALEARWTDQGAACLDKPRVDVHPTAASNNEFGVNADIYDMVQAHCPGKIPLCSDASLDTSGYHLVSATPF